MSKGSRCFDCFHDFLADEDRFAVLKKMRDFPPEYQGDEMELRRLESLTYDQVFVCGDCAGWYGDHPIRLTSDEVGVD